MICEGSPKIMECIESVESYGIVFVVRDHKTLQNGKGSSHRMNAAFKDTY